MPVFIASLLGGLIQAAGTLVGKVLISLGFGYVAYTGLNSSLDWLKAMVGNSMNQFAAYGQAVAVLSAMRAGEGVAILVSALGARLLLDGLSPQGVIKRLVLK